MTSLKDQNQANRNDFPIPKYLTEQDCDHNFVKAYRVIHLTFKMCMDDLRTRGELSNISWELCRPQLGAAILEAMYWNQWACHVDPEMDNVIRHALEWLVKDVPWSGI